MYTVHIHIAKMRNDVWQEAFLRLTHQVTQELHKGRRVLLFLSGGSVVELYKKLGEFLLKNEIDPSHIAFAQADERFRPEGTKQVQSSKFKVQNQEENINSYQIERTELWDVCKKKGFPYYVISQQGTLEESARQYDVTIRELLAQYPFRLAILGIGEDGHTAGLLPGYDRLWNSDRFIVGYHIEKRQNDTAGYFCQETQPFRKRITLTPKAFSILDYALVVATGAKKKEVLEKVFKTENRENIDTYPATLLQKIKKIDVYTDRN